MASSPASRPASDPAGLAGNGRHQIGDLARFTWVLSRAADVKSSSRSWSALPASYGSRMEAVEAGQGVGEPIETPAAASPGRVWTLFLPFATKSAMLVLPGEGRGQEQSRGAKQTDQTTIPSQHQQCTARHSHLGLAPDACRPVSSPISPLPLSPPAPCSSQPRAASINQFLGDDWNCEN